MDEDLRIGWSDAARLEIRYTANLKGDLEGLPYLATVVKTERGKHPEMILVDTGDFSGDGRPGRHAGAPQVEVMNHLRYDAALPGRAEASDSAAFRRMAEMAKFPFLASNWRGEGEGTAFHRRAVVRRTGVDVALLGLAWPETPRGVELVPPDQALTEGLAGLDLDTTLVIVLSQLGFAADRNVATTRGAEVQVLLEGVPYPGFNQVTQMGETLVVPAAPGPKTVGALGLDLSGALRIERDE